MLIKHLIIQSSENQSLTLHHYRSIHKHRLDFMKRGTFISHTSSFILLFKEHAVLLELFYGKYRGFGMKVRVSRWDSSDHSWQRSLVSVVRGDPGTRIAPRNGTLVKGMFKLKEYSGFNQQHLWHNPDYWLPITTKKIVD